MYRAAFYQIDMLMNKDMTFENLLEKQMASPERLFEIDHDNYVLQKLEKNKVTGFWYGMLIKARMNDRVNEIKAFSIEKGGYDKLPADALAAIQKVVDELN